MHAQEPKFFDDDNRKKLYDIFQKQKHGLDERFENARTTDGIVAGVKTYESLRKNANSVDNYHILSNLTLEQEREKIAYDGKSKEADLKKTSY